MNKIPITALALLVCGLCLQAQPNQNTRWRYASLTHGGIAVGSSKAAYTVQTIHGIQKKGLFTGIGIGIDNYGMPGFPLVAHLQKAFTTKGNQPFIYGQSGVQFAWKKDSWAEKVTFDVNKAEKYDLQNGFIGQLGGGYLFTLGKAKQYAIAFSAGYSYKLNTATYRQLAWSPISSYYPPGGVTETYSTVKQTFHYRRIVVRVGFMF